MGPIIGYKGLDNASVFFRIGIFEATMPGCEHKRTEFLMRRDGVDYLRCLDCDQVFESEDLEQLPAYYEEEEDPRSRKAS